jgi:copper chaperone
MKVTLLYYLQATPPGVGWQSEEAKMKELTIEGMTCAHCQASVTSALEAVPGVTNATVDLSAGAARVEGNADIQALIRAVEEEGYRARPAT